MWNVLWTHRCPYLSGPFNMPRRYTPGATSISTINISGHVLYWPETSNSPACESGQVIIWPCPKIFPQGRHHIWTTLPVSSHKIINYIDAIQTICVFSSVLYLSFCLSTGRISTKRIVSLQSIRETIQTDLLNTVVHCCHDCKTPWN